METKEKLAHAIIDWQLGQEAVLTMNEQDTLVDAVAEVARAAVAEAVAEEREACAAIAEYWDWRSSSDMTNDHIATAIRARAAASAEEA